MRFIEIFAIVFSSFLFAADDGRPVAALLEIGLFHSEEVSADSGGRWLGLLYNGENSSLTQTSIRIEQAEDPVVDGPGEMTGRRVSTDGPTPVFLVRGIQSMSAGHVQTNHFSPDGGSLVTRHGFVLGAQTYQLFVVGRRQRTDEKAEPSALMLSRGGITQKLYEWTEGLTEQHCELIWAGDLDGDQKLDLYMNVSEHYNVTHRRLFLSSAAGEGELVRQVASFRTVGC